MPDFSVVNPPQAPSYSAPLMQFEPFGNLYNDYFRGTQQGRELNLQKPIIDQNTGQPTTDPGTIINAMTARGGGPLAWEYVKGILPYIYGDIASKKAQSEFEAIGGGAGGRGQPIGGLPGTQNNPNATGPQGIRQSAPEQTVTSTESNATATPPIAGSVRALVVEAFGPDADKGPLPRRFAAALGVDLGVPLNTEQSNQLKSMMGRTFLSMGRGTRLTPDGETGSTPNAVASANAPGATPAPAVAVAPSAEPGNRQVASGVPEPQTIPGSETGPAEDTGGQGPGGRSVPFLAQQGGAAPTGGGGIASGGPAPVTSAKSAQDLPTSPPSRIPPGQGTVDPRLAEADRLTTIARRYGAAALGINPAIPGAKERAAQFNSEQSRLNDQAKQLRESALKDQERTGAQKEAYGEGDTVTGQKATQLAQSKDIERGTKAYEGIQAQSSQYLRDMKPYIDLSRGILNSPGIYTGIRGDVSLKINQVKAAFGDRNAALLQEALSKVTAVSVLGQINLQRDQLLEAGGQSSRIFSQQVGLVEKAAPQLENSVAGNLFLVNVSGRMGELSNVIADKARAYLMETNASGRKVHTHLDAGFDQQVADYLRKTPIFTKQETENPVLLGAPDAPGSLKTPQQVVDWAKSMGLGPEDSFRAPDGKYRRVGSARPAGAT